MKTSIFVLLSATVLVMIQACSGSAKKPTLNYNPNTITVSGLSSGGYMATQYQIAHSDKVTGAAILAAGPYFCAQGSLGTALARCVTKTDSEIDLSMLSEQLDFYANSSSIAPLSYLADHHIWLMHGTNDKTVNRLAADALFTQYSQYVEAENIVYINDKPFGHQFPTLDQGTMCGVSDSPFIGACNYDAAGELLTHILDKPLAPKATALSSKVMAFNQIEHGGEAANGLAEEGFIYIPSSCKSGEKCDLHVSFHGCNQSTEFIGQDYVEHIGLNEWADTNNLIILYPQTKRSMFAPLNPQGCWDWWGYSDKEYATNKGTQIQAIEAMINSFTSTH